MGITSYGSFNQSKSFLLATIYLVHINWQVGCHLPDYTQGLQREGHQHQSVRPGFPWQSPPTLSILNLLTEPLTRLNGRMICLPLDVRLYLDTHRLAS